MSYEIETSYFGSMPNQAWGSINDKRFYFRARHGDWTITIGPTDATAVGGELLAHGEDPDAGWWTDEEARKNLVKFLDAAVK